MTCRAHAVYIMWLFIFLVLLVLGYFKFNLIPNIFFFKIASLQLPFSEFIRYHWCVRSWD